MGGLISRLCSCFSSSNEYGKLLPPRDNESANDSRNVHESTGRGEYGSQKHVGDLDKPLPPQWEPARHTKEHVRNDAGYAALYEEATHVETTAVGSFDHDGVRRDFRDWDTNGFTQHETVIETTGATAYEKADGKKNFWRENRKKARVVTRHHTCPQCDKLIDERTCIRLETCRHDICKNCLSDVVVANIQMGNGAVRCPYFHKRQSKQCKSHLKHTEIQQMLQIAMNKNIDADMKLHNPDDMVHHNQGDIIHHNEGVLIHHNQNDIIHHNEAVPTAPPLSIGYEPNIDRTPYRTGFERYRQRYDDFHTQVNSEDVWEGMAGLQRDVVAEIEEFDDRYDIVPNSETFDCQICQCPVDISEGVTLRECLHSYCRDCLRGHITSKVTEHVIPCPHVDMDTNSRCPFELQEREIRALVDENTFATHQKHSVNFARTEEGNSFQCQGLDCDGWVVMAGILEAITEWRCDRCGTVNCVPCKSAHGGITCEQHKMNNMELQKQERDTENYLGSFITKGEAMYCPQCQSIVQKDEGCDWIKCMCQTELCWATKKRRWGPKGKGDNSMGPGGGCGCDYFNNKKCHPDCRYCH